MFFGYLFAIISAALFGSISTVAKPALSATIHPLLLSSIVYLVAAMVMTPIAYKSSSNATESQQDLLLVSQLGFKDIFLIGHDFGVQVAYSYAAGHPNDVRRLVILDVPIPGIGSGENITGLWWVQFHMVRDIPEMLVDGHEREYLTWFYKYTCNPGAITKGDIDEYVSHYSAPGGMRA